MVDFVTGLRCRECQRAFPAEALHVCDYCFGPLEVAYDYERIADSARRIVGAGHVRLAETLAERIAEACLADTRVSAVRVRVEKLDVFPDSASAGVEIERRQGN